jgi:20S proteasome subunit alpha 6
VAFSLRLTIRFRRFLQTECASWRWDFKEPVPLQVLSNRIQLKLQANTQYYGRRPFGVGLVLAGYDVSFKKDHLIY